MGSVHLSAGLDPEQPPVVGIGPLVGGFGPLVGFVLVGVGAIHFPLVHLSDIAQHPKEEEQLPPVTAHGI